MKNWRRRQLPLQVLPLLRVPLLSKWPGQSLAHDVKRLALGKRLRAWLTSASSNSAARRLTTVLPATTLAEALGTARIHRAAARFS
jgi:hypothetical protein